LLSQIRDLLQAGRTGEAATLAGLRETRDIHDAAVHLQWAEILEELGLIDEVVMELNLAIRDDPEKTDAHVRLAEIYLDQGQPLRAARVRESLVRRSPLQAELYRDWGEALEAAGEFEKARAAYNEGLEKTGDPILKGLLGDLDFLSKSDESPGGDGETPDNVVSKLLPQTHHLIAFMSLFGGREGVYARQWVSPTGESGYTPVEEPLTPKVAENHLLGNFTIGVYPVRLDNTVNFIAFDIDIAKFAVRETITNKRRWDGVMARAQETACRIVDLGAAWEVPVYLEDSGFKGRHAWVFLEAPVPAGVAKKFGELIVASLLPLPREISTEVFPRQGSVTRGGLGNLIKLPLGVHRRTGRRSCFIMPDGTDYPDQLEFLLKVRKAGRRSIYAFIQQAHHRQTTYFHSGGELPGRALPGLPSGVADGAAHASRLPYSPTFTEEGGAGEFPPWEEEKGPEDRTGTGARRGRPTLSSQMAGIPEEYRPEQDRELQTLLSRCAVIRALVEQVHRIGRLSHEETQVLIHTVGHLEHGPAAVNNLFERAWQADPALFLKSRLRGNPMSCPKIRIRIPEITAAVGCNCVFDLETNLYPSPLLHVREREVVAGAGGLRPLPAVAVDSLEFQNFLQDYLKLRKQLRESQSLLTRYEERLAGFFDETGVESVITALGELRRDRKAGEKPVFVLEI